MKKRNSHSAEFKAKVALEAIRGEKTVNEIAGSVGVHPGMIAQWKRQLLEGCPTIFTTRVDRAAQEQQSLVDCLYQEIGQLKVELDWLKKKSGLGR